MTDEAIIAAALGKPDPAGRTAYLAEACAGDPEQRNRIERLIAAHDLTTAAPDRPPTQSFGDDLGVTQVTGTDQDDTHAHDVLAFLQPRTRSGTLGRLGHYEVLEVLGRGGFGVVFRAFDEVLQRVVALKVLAPSMATTSPARKRFLREARSGAAIRHENVVQIFAVGEEPLPHLVMEYIPGETLEQRLARTGPLDGSEVRVLGRQIAAGLAAAHEQGLIHRDVKPANVLIEKGPQPRVKLTDFGLARTADDASLSRSGTVVGTPLYMSPEQAKGAALDPRADLFSFGSLLYTMCTGHPPFRADTTFGVLRRVTEETPRPIRELIPEMPQALCDVIAKLHAKNPADRYQTAREVADLLAADPLAAAEPNAPKVEPKPRAAPPYAAQSRRLVLAVGVLAVAILVGLGIDALIRQGRRPEPADKDAPEPLPQPAPVVRVESPPRPRAPFDAKKAKDHQETWAKHLGVPVEFTNAAGMKFRLIPPGEYRRGGAPEEIQRALEQLGDGYLMVLEGEDPQHWVVLDEPFALGATEVTRGQFRQFVRETGYKTDAERDPPVGHGLVEGGWVRKKEFYWDTDPGYRRPMTDADPVVNVTHNDAREFCRWASGKDGRTHALPTEAQWEFACRAGTETPWWTGGWPGAERHLQKATWYHATDTAAGFRPVGSFDPNPFGLFDMHGNVEEWCSDWYAEYPDEPVQRNPTGPTIPTNQRSVRSSNFNVGPAGLRSAYRIGDDPNLPSASRGFRVAIIGDLKPKP